MNRQIPPPPPFTEYHPSSNVLEIPKLLKVFVAKTSTDRDLPRESDFGDLNLTYFTLIL